MCRSSPVAGTSFVIRLWLEKRAPIEGPEWRFEVRHVQSGEQTHGRTLADLMAFVERQAGVPAPRFPATTDRAEEVHL